MSTKVRYGVNGRSFQRRRRSVLMVGSIALALFAAGALEAVAAERATRRGDEQESRAEAMTLTQRGVESIADQKFEEALEAFDRAIEADENYGMVHYQRGRVLAQMGRMEEAKESLLRSTVLQPGFAHGHQLSSLAAQQLADYETAWDQAVRAVLAGRELSEFDRLQQVSPPPPDIDDRLAAWKVFVVGIDTRELMNRDEVPFNARRGARDTSSTLAQVQPDLLELQRLLSNAVSDTPGFGLVPDAEMAQYFLVITPESISADPRNTMEGEFRLHEVDGNKVAFVRKVSFRNLSAESAVTVEIQQFINVLENWKRERQ